MEIALLYFWLRLDTLAKTLIVFLAVAGTGAGVAALVWLLNEEIIPSLAAKAKAFLLKALWRAVLPLTLILVALPSKTDVAILVGGHYALKAVESPEAAKVMTLMRAKANALLDEAIEAANKSEPKK